MERLLELQELDLSIDRLEARRVEIESGEQVSAARDAADALENRLGELRLSLDSVRREQERLDAEVSSLDSKIAAEEKRLYDGSVANPKELESIQHEIESLRQRKRRIEDGELEQMERREDMDARVPPLEGELAEARARLAELDTSSDVELKEVVHGIGDRRSERETLVTEFDPELLELYEDLRASKRGVGAAALQDGVCGGCRQKLSALEREQVKKTEGVRRCPSCRRILILT
ncbi:MAG TPA: C4-type zinc ribbon domain-containing protein [Actinomycetota bacterium]|nr:C4-type zinc ribbon domain-containing protein [Actinomycetota bacterium]